jgi:3-deoxy-manno-octulosonate cytidylyltransferase (CMP-KDO synthetase)
VLARLTMLERTALEITESLEQNRWIENGFSIRTALTEWESIGIDTPEDLEKAKSLLDILK